MVPARRGGMVPEPSMFSCAGRVSFPHILPWSCLPGEGNRNGSRFGDTSFSRLHASIRSPRQTSLAHPARGIVPCPSMFPCAGRIACPHILPWSCPPGKGCVHYTRSLPRIVWQWQPSMNAQASGGLALPVMPCVHYTITRLDSKVPLGSRSRIFTEFIHIFLTFFQNPPVSAYPKLCYNKITLQS